MSEQEAGREGLAGADERLWRDEIPQEAEPTVKRLVGHWPECDGVTCVCMGSTVLNGQGAERPTHDGHPDSERCPYRHTWPTKPVDVKTPQGAVTLTTDSTEEEFAAAATSGQPVILTGTVDELLRWTNNKRGDIPTPQGAVPRTEQAIKDRGLGAHIEYEYLLDLHDLCDATADFTFDGADVRFALPKDQWIKMGRPGRITVKAQA